MKYKPRAKILLPAIALIIVLGFPTSVQAQGPVYGDTVPAGTTLDQDVVLIGQNVSIAGTVNGNVFILGNQVRIDGTVNGSLILIGQNAQIGGMVSGGTYALALTLELSPGATLDRDLYVTTVSLVSGQESSIGRDLFAVGLDAGLNGSVNRDLHTAIGPIQLYNGLMRLLGFDELTLELHFNLPQPAPETQVEPVSRFVSPARTRLFPSRRLEETSFDWTLWGIDIAREWIVFSLFGLLAFWLARKPLEVPRTPFLARPLRTTANGLLVFVIAINLFVVAGLVGVLIFSIGLALNTLGLWQLSLALWIGVYALLALAMTVLWLFIVYGSKIVLIYALSTWLSEKINPENWVPIIAMVLGLLIYVLLRSVPMVGWVIGVLVTAAGMGAAWDAYRISKQIAAPKSIPKRQPAVKKKSKAKP